MTHRNLQLREDIPGICNNKSCDNYKAFELYEVEEIKDDEHGGYVFCTECKQKIYVED